MAAAFMCARQAQETTGADLLVGTTIDQIIAKKIGGGNLMPSMQLAVEDPGSASSNCGEGYSCTYTNTISWSSPTQSLPMELNPQVVFERMFGDGGTIEQRAARRRRDGSILDSLTGSLNRLKGQASTSDKAKLDDYTENVREIERRLQIAMKASGVERADLTVPIGVPQTFDEHIKLPVRPARAGLPGRYHPRWFATVCTRSDGPHLPGERSPHGWLPRCVASRRKSQADR